MVTLSVPWCSLQLLPARTTARGLSSSCIASLFDSLRLFLFVFCISKKPIAGHCTLVAFTIVAGLITFSNQEVTFFFASLCL
jgi:hypothetical protein